MQQAILRQKLPSFVIGIDADEAQNRVLVVVEDNSDEVELRAVVERAGVPWDAVVVQLGNRPVLTANLREKVRPLGAGLQTSNGGTLCTMGFIVDMVLYDVRGFLTAGHCRGTAAAVGDGVTGSPIYQANVAALNQVGDIEVNPAWSWAGPGSLPPDCGGYYNCVWADVMFVKRSGVSLSNMPKQMLGSTSVPSSNTPGSFGINTSWSGFEIGMASVGDSVDKVGRLTGRTRGVVTNTCFFESFPIGTTPETYVTVRCANKVEGASFGYTDSGSPVFFPGVPPTALGILFGGAGTFSGSSCVAGCEYYFSDWDAIELQLSRFFIP
jgi:hypothetical protein